MQEATNKLASLDDYEEKLQGKTCRWCEGISLTDEPVQHYDHDGGYAVEGFEKKQWLYVECPKCKYQWALHKLKIGEINER